MDRRNSHILGDSNPNAKQPRACQERFGINVWAGITDGHLIGPNVLPYRLTGPRYLTFSFFPTHELSGGCIGGVAVHAKHAIRSSGGPTGSPRGTTLVVQPLEVCNTNSET